MRNGATSIIEFNSLSANEVAFWRIGDFSRRLLATTLVAVY